MGIASQETQHWSQLCSSSSWKQSQDTVYHLSIQIKDNWHRIISASQDQEGYTLPSKIKPTLTRQPLVKSGYTNLLPAIGIALPHPKAGHRTGHDSIPTGYFNFFLVPKPDNKWMPILDLSTLSLSRWNPKSIKLSIPKGQWVTSLDSEWSGPPQLADCELE